MDTVQYDIFCYLSCNAWHFFACKIQCYLHNKYTDLLDVLLIEITFAFIYNIFTHARSCLSLGLVFTIKYENRHVSSIYFCMHVFLLFYSNDDNCMLRRSASYNASALDEYSQRPPGQVFPPDEQCQEQYGEGSYLYRVSNLYTILHYSNKLWFILFGEIKWRLKTIHYGEWFVMCKDVRIWDGSYLYSVCVFLYVTHKMWF